MNRRPAAVILTLWLAPAMAWGHAGAFILAKCSTAADGGVSLELTVDYGQHPTLTDREAALVAMRQVLLINSATGPVALDVLAPAVTGDSTVPDPSIPFPADPPEAGRAHALVKMRYSWKPGVPEIRFSVPAGNPHDVLFWLAGAACPANAPAPWRILIAGDVSPPVPVPMPVVPAEQAHIGVRLLLAAAMGLVLAALVWWRRSRLVLS